jgi:Mg2+ and Co2+ transporter CorA
MKFDKLTEAYLKVVKEASYHQDAIEQDISKSSDDVDVEEVYRAADIMEKFYSTLSKAAKNPKVQARYKALQYETQVVMQGLKYHFKK